ncbi:MAG: 2-ketoglutaric semialdehyde dehydrogenase (EC [uncultured Paraburkholderia sp.]|nr:MAG: 2-ketoglutaric semialdehyde dehydrogenase (EC [uncultured Paraburkholderia sp.]
MRLLFRAGAVRRRTRVSHRAREDIFGSLAVVLRADDYDHALHLANDTACGSCAGICTRSLSRARHFGVMCKAASSRSICRRVPSNVTRRAARANHRLMAPPISFSGVP